MKSYCFAAMLLLLLSACHNGHDHNHDDAHDHDHDHSGDGHHDSSNNLPTDSTQQNFIIEPDSLNRQSPQ